MNDAISVAARDRRVARPVRPDGEDDALVVGLYRQLAGEVEQSEGREEQVLDDSSHDPEL